MLAAADIFPFLQWPIQNTHKCVDETDTRMGIFITLSIFTLSLLIRFFFLIFIRENDP